VKLSTRSRYGLRLLVALGASEKKKPVFLNEIAKSENISEKYLSQIIMTLKAIGIVSTFRGAHGGYVLTRPASEITLLEIIEPLEGDLGLVNCIKKSDSCVKATECVTRNIWSDLSSLITDYLKNHTLDELIDRYKKNISQDIVNFSI
jgi:Rrf2 family transcriptional regulator, cysteine metabolism repressor